MRFQLLLLAALCPVGGTVAQDRGLEFEDPVAALGPGHALVIGIDDYGAGWPPLFNASKDARLVAETLEALNFEVAVHVDRFDRSDDGLGGEELRRLFREFFVSEGRDETARLFVWFAGHGYSKDGLGFLVPADAPPPDDPGFGNYAIPMQEFNGFLVQAKARHVLGVFDSCFSGTIFRASRSAPTSAIRRQLRLPVRQFITSGDAEQQVSDDGTFRELFVQAVQGEDDRADGDGDGFLTGSELGHFLFTQMTNRTRERQTPRWGKVPEFDRGDYVFRLPADMDKDKNESLEECSPKLRMRAWRQIPLGLTYTIGRALEPYWVRVEVHNECSTSLFLRVELDSDDPEIDFISRPATLTVLPGQDFSRLIDPRIRFLGPEIDETQQVKLNWAVKDESQRTLLLETFDYDVLPRTHYRFDLARSDGEPVSREFLLASLSAWTRLDRDPSVLAFADEVRRKVTRSEDPTRQVADWLAAAATLLFSGEQGLDVLDGFHQFPPAPNRVLEIRTVDQLLDLRGSAVVRSVEPVEAIVAMASLTRAGLGSMGVAAGLVAVPFRAEGSPLKRLFFGWRDPVTGAWSFFDPAHCSAEPFDMNRRESTRQIQALLRDRPDLQRQLDASGVAFTDHEDLLVLDFERAAEQYRIANLR